MRNLLLIIAREYVVRVRTRAFLIFTLIMPLLVGGLVVLPGMVMMRDSSTRRVTIVAADPALAAAVQSELNTPRLAAHVSSGTSPDLSRDVSKDASRNASRDSAAVREVPPPAGSSNSDEDGEMEKSAQPEFDANVAGPPSEALRRQLTADVRHGHLDAFVWIDGDIAATPRATYYARNTGDFVASALLRRALRVAIEQRKLAAYGFSPAQTKTLLGAVTLDTVRVDRDGASRSNGMGAYLLPFLLLFAIYLTVLVYGINVMRSVIEDKSSRVLEVLLGSVTPMQLMAGKIIGVGAVGLTQIFLWTAASVLLGSSSHAVGNHLLGDAIKDAHISTPVLCLFPVFFLLGYSTYACLYAAIGAMVNSDDEASHFQFPLTLPLLLCMVFSTSIIGDPNSPLAFWLSLFPLTSPILMFVRVSVGAPPPWQVALSIGISLATLYGLVWLSSRIYRVGILMYGKRPTLAEVRKWIRYA